MTNYNELVKRLREVTEDDAYAMPWTFGVTCHEAADAIEALTQDAVSLRGEVEMLRNQRDQAEARYTRACQMLDRTHTSADTAEAERDAALARVALRDGECQAKSIIISDLERRIAALTPQPDAGLEALFKRACEVVHHDHDCPAIGGRGDADCQCDAVPFLNDFESALRSRPAGEVKVKPLVWSKTEEGLPQKPGLRDYEQIECLIYLPNGDLEISMWNCEHEVWDDAEGDDFRHDPLYPTHWLSLARIREALEHG